MQTDGRRQPAGWVTLLRGLSTFLVQPFKSHLPFAETFQVRQCINLHKLLVLPVYLAALWKWGGEEPFAFGQSFGPAALCLLICHGLYGILWVYKDVHFGDPSWHAPMSLLGFVIIFTYPLGAYYLPMVCLTSRSCPGGTFGAGNEPVIVGAGLFCYTLGMFFAYGADCQKYFVLKYQRPRALVTDGFFSHSRNPNYFGEVMIYMGYGIWSCSYVVLLTFLSVWLLIFLPNMKAKDASMARYPQWQAWADRTGMFFPWLPSLIRDLVANSFSRMGEDSKKEPLVG